MTHTPHDLADDFPGQAALIAGRKARDAHFARLVERYAVVNEAVYRAEAGLEPMSTDHETALRRERMQLKDDIARALRAAAPAS
ncbi:MAG: DUF465 domain-containing protein [Rhodobacteraceae bacterium]|jgi:hypothetical protein|nr:DUF465 domain-containing protein [Paracoccaceae bacterium]